MFIILTGKPRPSWRGGFTLLENNGVDIPEIVKEAEILTVYATDTRYPGDWEPVEEEEYIEALRHAKTVFDWVSEKLKGKIGDAIDPS